MMPMAAGRAGRVHAWRPTWALRRAVLTLLAAVSLALVTGRSSVALLVLPLAVGSALAWSSRRGDPLTRLTVETPPMADQGGKAEAGVDLVGLDNVDLAVVALPAGIRRGDAPVLVVATTLANQRLAIPIDTDAWGVRDYGAAGLRVACADGLFASEVVTAHVPPTRVLPRVGVTPVPELAARTAGQVGVHRTRRPGDGSELVDVREFRPGDKIRRIDWRVSARRGALHVRHTAIDADADLVICVDARWDVAADVAGWADRIGRRQAGTLDTSVEACAALAAAYLRQGDRVGLVDLTMRYRGVPLGSGRRQLMRIRWQLAGFVADAHLRMRQVDETTVPAGATAVVFTPYLDDEIGSVITRLARTGRDVLAIDVLPRDLTLPRSRTERTAARLILAEREERIATARRLGVLVTPWDPELIGVLLRRKHRLRGSA